MTHLVFESKMPCPQARLWEFHSNSEALHQLSPPGSKVSLKGEMRVIDGARLEVTSSILGLIHQDWEVELSNVNPPHGFTDSAIKSPFKEWQHNHLFFAEPQGSRLRDEVSFIAPGGHIGRLASIIIVTILFKFRHFRTKTLLKR